MASGSPEADSASTRSAYNAVSDTEGKFAIDQIAPGRYTLSAEHPGYLPGIFRSGGSAVITIEAGQAVSDLHVQLIPYGVISGRVVDEDGEPATEVQIFAMRFGRSNGRRSLQGLGLPTSVDDQGVFRIANVRPGRYILYGRKSHTGNADTAPMQYVLSYYPNGVDISEAAPLTVMAGAEANATIRLQRRRVFRVQGKVSDSGSGATASNFFLMLTPQNGNPELVTFGNRPSAYVRDGGFEFKNVLPGSYIIEPSNVVSIFTGPKGRETIAAKLFGRHPVTLTDHDLTGLDVPLRAGITVTGTITTETTGPLEAQSGKGGLPARPSTSLRLTAESATGRDFEGQSAADGTFQISEVAPDRYRLSVSGLPDNSFVKAVRLGDQDTTNGILDLGAGVGATVHILISPKAAGVSGDVHNYRGESTADVLVTVSPLQAAPATEPPPMRHARTDRDGRFRIDGLAPGEYQVLAWEDVELDLVMDREFQRAFESRAITVKLRESSQESVDLKLVPRDAIREVEAKIE